MSEPVVITLKAANKTELVEKLRLGASMGWEVRYALDRDNARLLADAIEDCLQIEADTERACNAAIANIAKLRDEALTANADTIRRLKRNIAADILIAALCLTALASIWWAA